MKNLLVFVFLIATTLGYGQIFDVGIVTGPMTTIEINAIVGPQEGRQVYNETTQTIWLWDGTQWIDTAIPAGGIDWSTPVDANILPDTDQTYDIGAVGNVFQNMYANTFNGSFFGSNVEVNTASASQYYVIYPQASDLDPIGFAAGRVLLFNNSTDTRVKLGIGGTSTVEGIAYLSDIAAISGFIPITGSSAITGTLSPSVSGANDLGSGSNRWGNLNVEAIDVDQNALFNPTDVEPSGVKGKVYFDDSEATLKQYTGAAWEPIGSGAGGTDDQIALEVPFTPAGDIAATDVQNAIEEVDDEKVGTNPLSPVQNLDSWMGTKAEFLIDDPVGSGVKLIYITDSLPSTPTGTVLEGVNVLSTGEVTTKVLTTDGDGTSSWQVASGGGDAYLANTQTFTGVNTFSVADNLFYNTIRVQGISGGNNTSQIRFVDNATPTSNKATIGYSDAGAPGITINNQTASTTIGLYNNGTTVNSALAGTGTEMVVADATGFLTRQAIPTGTGDALTTNPLSQFAPTTSAELAGVISDETGSGALVFGTSPVLASPTLGIATATTINGVTLTSGSLNGTVTGTNTGDQTSIVGITGTTTQFNTALTGDDFAFLSATQTITGAKTFSSGDITINDNVDLRFGTSGGETLLSSDGTNLRLDLIGGAGINIYDVDVNPMVGWEAVNDIWFSNGSMSASDGLTTGTLTSKNWNNNDTDYVDDAIVVFSDITMLNGPVSNGSTIMKSHTAGNVNNSWAITKEHGNNQNFYLSDHGSGSWRHAPVLVQESGTFTPDVIGVGNVVSYTATKNASYVRQGNICTFSILLSSVSGTTPTGNIRITDLPFTSDALALVNVEMTGGSVNFYSVHGKIFDSADYIQLYYQSSLDASNNTNMSDVDFTSGIITVTGTYIIQ